MSKHTKGPWTAHNMVHEEGRPMTPYEIGEYVANSVRMSPETRFLFISGQNDGVDVDVCHVGNGPKGPWNAKLIAAAPELLETLEAWVDLAERHMSDYVMKMDANRTADFAQGVRETRAILAKAKGA